MSIPVCYCTSEDGEELGIRLTGFWVWFATGAGVSSDNKSIEGGFGLTVEGTADVAADWKVCA